MSMKERYELLLSLKSLDYEISELLQYVKECKECFGILHQKLDLLCQFILSEENIQKWNEWGEDKEIQCYCEQLRETAVQALCDMEKYQSLCTYHSQFDMSEYIDQLSVSVRKEMDELHINQESKVLFIGSGAFPTTALTIAKETGAHVMGVDIDGEAIQLARKLTELSGLHSTVKFSSEELHTLAYAKEATHIIIASLVQNKMEVLNCLKDFVQPATSVIVRYGNGLKSVFNYPFKNELSNEWIQTKTRENEAIYDTIILNKAGICV
ncbi:methyltransferase domain-containing protein [Priestia megaterium]|nr:methyltransferase domain-containing protein [Priestia megaterium]